MEKILAKISQQRKVAGLINPLPVQFLKPYCMGKKAAFFSVGI